MIEIPACVSRIPAHALDPDLFGVNLPQDADEKDGNDDDEEDGDGDDDEFDFEDGFLANEEGEDDDDDGQEQEGEAHKKKKKQKQKRDRDRDLELDERVEREARQNGRLRRTGWQRGDGVGAERGGGGCRTRPRAGMQGHGGGFRVAGASGAQALADARQREAG